MSLLQPLLIGSDPLPKSWRETMAMIKYKQEQLLNYKLETEAYDRDHHTRKSIEGGYKLGLEELREENEKLSSVVLELSANYEHLKVNFNELNAIKHNLQLENKHLKEKLEGFQSEYGDQMHGTNDHGSPSVRISQLSIKLTSPQQMNYNNPEEVAGEERNDSKQEELDDLNSDLKRLARIAQLEEELALKEDQMRDIYTYVERLEKEQQEQSARVQSLEEEREKLLEKVNEQSPKLRSPDNKKISSLTKQVQDLSIDVKSLQERLSKEKEYSETLEVVKIDLESKLQKKEKKIKELENALTSQKESTPEPRDSARNEGKRSNQSSLDEAVWDQMNTKILALETQNKSLTMQLTQCKESLREAQNDMIAFGRREQQLTLAHEEAVRELEARVDQLANELSEVKAQKDQLHQELDERDSQLRTIQTTSPVIKRTEESIIKESPEKADNSVLQQELEGLKKEYDDLKQEKLAIESNNQKLITMLNEANESKISASQSFEKFKKEKEAAISHLKEQLLQQELKTTELTLSIDQKNAENTSLINMLEVKSKELTSKDEEIRRVAASVDKMKTSNETLQANIQSLNDNIKELADKLTQKEHTIENLNTEIAQMKQNYDKLKQNSAEAEQKQNLLNQIHLKTIQQIRQEKENEELRLNEHINELTCSIELLNEVAKKEKEAHSLTISQLEQTIRSQMDELALRKNELEVNKALYQKQTDELEQKNLQLERLEEALEAERKTVAELQGYLDEKLMIDQNTQEKITELKESLNKLSSKQPLSTEEAKLYIHTPEEEISEGEDKEVIEPEEIPDYQPAMSDLDREIKLIRAENDDLRATIEQLQLKIQACTEENTDLLQQIDALRAESKGMAEKCTEQEAEIVQISLKLQSLGAEKEKLEGEIRAVEKQHKVTKQLLEEQKIVVNELKGKIEEKKQQIIEKNMEIEVLNSKLVESTHDARRQLKEIERIIEAKHQSEITSLQHSFETKNNELQAKLKKLEDEEGRKDKLLESLHKENEYVQKEIRNKEFLIEELKKEQASLLNERKLAEQRLSEKEELIENTKIIAEKTAAELHQRIEGLERSVQEKESRIQELQREIEQERATQQELSECTNKLAFELDQVRKELEEQTSTCLHEKEKLKKKDLELLEAKSENRELQRQITKLNQNDELIGLMKKQLERMNSQDEVENSIANKERKQLEADLSQLRVENESLQHQLSQKTNELQELARLEQQWVQDRNELDQAQTKIDELRKKNEEILANEGQIREKCLDILGLLTGGREAKHLEESSEQSVYSIIDQIYETVFNFSYQKGDKTTDETKDYSRDEMIERYEKLLKERQRFLEVKEKTAKLLEDENVELRQKAEATQAELNSVTTKWNSALTQVKELRRILTMVDGLVLTQIRTLTAGSTEILPEQKPITNVEEDLRTISMLLSNKLLFLSDRIRELTSYQIRYET